MKSRELIQIVKKNWQLFWLLLVVALIPLLFNHRLHRWRHFRQVRKQFESEMDPIKLQEWTTTILREHHDSFTNVPYPHPGWYGTNLPPNASKMIEKYFYHPVVEVHPDHVIVFGSERGGEPQIFVGATNFVFEREDLELWKPGIYIAIPAQTE